MGSFKILSDDFFPELIQNPRASSLVEKLLKGIAHQQDESLLKRMLRGLLVKFADDETKIREMNKLLLKRQATIESDLEAASVIQYSLLPRTKNPVKEYAIDWCFIPSTHIGGDVFNIIPIDDDHTALYILDVTGHGVPAAMMTVLVSQMILPIASITTHASLSEELKSLLLSPSKVLNLIENELSKYQFNKMLTMFYCVIEASSQKIVYGNAGHPSPVIISPAGDLHLLEPLNTLIGAGLEDAFESIEKPFNRGDKLFLYTDGITECIDDQNRYFGEERLYSILKANASEMISVFTENIRGSILDFTQEVPFRDDVTFLALEAND